MKKTLRYRVLTLDVWGHAPEECEDYDCNGNCDGFTVNDRFGAGRIEIEADGTEYNAGTPRAFTSYAPTDEQIVSALVDKGILSDGTTTADVEVDWPSDDTYVEINNADNGCPLLQLELQEEP